MSNFLPYLLSSVWAIDEAYMTGYLPLVSKLLEGENIPIPNFDASLYAASTLEYDVVNQSSADKKMRIGVIPIKNAITKYDVECGPRGTKSMIRELRGFDRNSDISAVILHIDSGGGEAAGTKEFVDEIKSFSKPIIAFVDGMAASAAYWIASAADEIIVNSKQDILGSIGTLFSFIDVKGIIEARGGKVHEIYASLSTQKNSWFKAALEGDYKPIQKEILDPFNEAFHASVKENRPQISANKEIFTGKTYLGDKALANGLADTEGNFDFAISRALALAKNPNDSTKNNLDMSEVKEEVIANNVFAKLKNMFGQSDGSLPNVKELQSQIAAFQKSDTEKADKIKALDAALTLAKEETKNISNQLDSWKAQAIKLGAKENGEFPVLEQEGDDNVVTTEPTELSADFAWAKEQGIEI